jgi:hypothetical protein
MSVELIRETGKRLSNWGRWGADDQRGTLNHVSAESIRHAATLVKTGRLFRLGFNYDENGPQIGSVRGRINPIHTMLQHAGDAALATPAPLLGHGYTDDIVLLPLQCSTQSRIARRTASMNSCFPGRRYRSPEGWVPL